MGQCFANQRHARKLYIEFFKRQLASTAAGIVDLHTAIVYGFDDYKMAKVEMGNQRQSAPRQLVRFDQSGL